AEKKYVNEKNLQTAMTEYNKGLEAGRVVETQYGDTVGFVSKINDNETGAGEQTQCFKTKQFML
ncbi:hypothetical protein DDV23_11245, partial [Streptococcus chenjunshii]